MPTPNSLTTPVEFKYFKAESLTEDQLAAAYRQYFDKNPRRQDRGSSIPLVHRDGEGLHRRMRRMVTV